jgi:hypothetical protein
MADKGSLRQLLYKQARCLIFSVGDVSQKADDREPLCDVKDNNTLLMCEVMYSINYGKEGASESVSDVRRYVIRKLLDSISNILRIVTHR